MSAALPGSSHLRIVSADIANIYAVRQATPPDLGELSGGSTRSEAANGRDMILGVIVSPLKRRFQQPSYFAALAR